MTTLSAGASIRVEYPIKFSVQFLVSYDRSP